jgi:hypothetical protein
MSELRNLWALINADLKRARNMLPDDAASDATIRGYQEYIDQNELELACDMLEAYAMDHEASREFWFALRDAATKMDLSDRSSRYEKRASS